jgi:hypothetical protein
MYRETVGMRVGSMRSRNRSTQLSVCMLTRRAAHFASMRLTLLFIPVDCFNTVSPRFRPVLVVIPCVWNLFPDLGSGGPALDTMCDEARHTMPRTTRHGTTRHDTNVGLSQDVTDLKTKLAFYCMRNSYLERAFKLVLQLGTRDAHLALMTLALALRL